MAWQHVLVLGASGIAAMRAALERGDLDEAVRQGALAGPVVVERALHAGDRATRLAGIAAAPVVEDRAELLDALADAAGGPDRRTAIPAAAAARAIARELERQGRPDDLAADDVAGWRATWSALALRGDRWIELRVDALDTAAALDPAGIGVDLATALRDPDPAFRRAACAVVPSPPPTAAVAARSDAVAHDADRDVALAAARSLCGALDARSTRATLAGLGADGVARLRGLVTSQPRLPPAAVRELARCLSADGTAGSTAALRAVGFQVGR